GDARTAALGPGGRRLRAPPAPPDPARGDPRPRRGAGRGLRADPQGLAPVGAACHGGAMETAVVAGVSAMSEAKRLAGEKAIEYVEDGIVVGVGTGATVAYVLDALAGARDRAAGAVARS